MKLYRRELLSNASSMAVNAHLQASAVAEQLRERDEIEYAALEERVTDNRMPVERQNPVDPTTVEDLETDFSKLADALKEKD